MVVINQRVTCSSLQSAESNELLESGYCEFPLHCVLSLQGVQVNLHDVLGQSLQRYIHTCMYVQYNNYADTCTYEYTYNTCMACRKSYVTVTHCILSNVVLILHDEYHVETGQNSGHEVYVLVFVRERGKERGAREKMQTQQLRSYRNSQLLP